MTVEAVIFLIVGTLTVATSALALQCYDSGKDGKDTYKKNKTPKYIFLWVNLGAGIIAILVAGYMIYNEYHGKATGRFIA